MLRSVWDDFISLFYPPLCAACHNALNKEEKYVCLACEYELPHTNYHLHPNNPIEQLFHGRVPVKAATAYFYFEKNGKVQQLIHNIKYHSQKEVALYCGASMGKDLRQSPQFNAVDFIIPVPLHKSKQRLRGYNQSELLAKGIASIMQKEVKNSNLIRRIKSTTQTKKNRIERWENVHNIFDVLNPQELNNKHILLIDDVITTGATLEACCNALINTCENIEISIATLGVPHR